MQGVCRSVGYIQWVPSHCNIPGKEDAGRLGLGGWVGDGVLPQKEQLVSCEEAKTIADEKQRRLLQQHPVSYRRNSCYQLWRENQVVTV